MAKRQLPIVPIRSRVLFPFTALKLTLGRPASLALVRAQFAKFVNASAQATRDADLFIGIATVVPSSERPDGSSKTEAEHGDDVYGVGCLAKVVKLSQTSSGSGGTRYTMVVHGVRRMQILRYVQHEPYRVAVLRTTPDVDRTTLSPVALACGQHIREAGARLLSHLKQRVGVKARGGQDLNIDALSGEPERLAFNLIFASGATVAEKMKVLSADSVEERLQAALDLITTRVQVMKAYSDIQTKVTDKLKSGRRQFFLRQQLKAIQDELRETDGGDDDDSKSHLEELQARLDTMELPPDARKATSRQLDRLQRMSPQSPEYGMVITYLEWMADLPWSVTTGHIASPDEAAAQLDADHAGLDRVKRRIIEHLAVRTLNPSSKSPILLLVGPPGVGKTSLGRSIAATLGRSFHRVSLGGVRDVAEIRGHRRTYIGAMPGIIIQTLKRAGSRDPVILLDEIDKLGRDHRGDPSSALLEVLDPEQNSTFRDHYLGVPFDLSRVLFVATANSSETIPAPLLDRMETLRLPGYTVPEKAEIAAKYLWPKVLRDHGLQRRHVTIAAPMFRRVIEEYTREAGVRGLERCLGALCRRAAVSLAQHRSLAQRAKADGDELDHGVGAAAPKPPAHNADGDGKTATDADGDGRTATDGDENMEAATDTDENMKAATDADGNRKAAPDGDEGGADGSGNDGCCAADATFPAVDVTAEFVTAVLGSHGHPLETAPKREDMVPGVVMGLSWTPIGGRLMVVETTHMPGSGKLKLTGQLGEVLQESAFTALSWIRSHAQELGLHAKPTRGKDIHIHFPAGAVPKDGPSAGIAIATALVSSFTGRVAREDTAMTGEITLRGAVLPVGGIKEKLLGAHRGGVKRVIIPAQNKRALVDVPDTILKELEILHVSRLDQVFQHAFRASPLLDAPAAPSPLAEPAPADAAEDVLRSFL